jgi:hypothetical protein
MGCRPTSGDANRAGDNQKDKVGIRPDFSSCKENIALKAEYWGAQESRRFQTSAKKEKNLSVATQNPGSFIAVSGSCLCRVISD